MFKDLRRGGYLFEKQLNYYSFKYKNACNPEKLYLLPLLGEKGKVFCSLLSDSA